MNVHEHQAKEILKKYGIATPNGVFGFTVEDVVEKSKKLTQKNMFLKHKSMLEAEEKLEVLKY